MAQVETKKDTKNELQLSHDELAKLNLVMPKNIADKVFNTLSVSKNDGRLTFPKNYSIGNALTSAYLMISQDSKLKACSNESVIQSMIDMATMGLNPSKNQCYFIPMGNRCTLITSYFGKMASIKNLHGVKTVNADVIYKDTDYELLVDDYGNDDIRIIKPCPLDKRKKENIIGAWAKIWFDADVWGQESYCSILTIDDINASHKMGSAKGNSKAHQDFFGEMAKKSAINRCVKYFTNSTLDDNIMIDTIVRTTENDYKEQEEQLKVYEQKNVNANDIFNAQVVEKEEPKIEKTNVEKVEVIVENQNENIQSTLFDNQFEEDEDDEVQF